MEKKLTALTIVVCLLSTNALAVMGPTATNLEKNKFAVEMYYSIFGADQIKGKESSQMTIINEWTEQSWERVNREEIPTRVRIPMRDEQTITTSGDFVGRLKKNDIFARFKYSPLKNWEVFLGIGSSNIQDQDITSISAYEVGTKITFLKKGPLKFGAIAKIGVFNWEGDTEPTAETVTYNYTCGPPDVSTMAINGKYNLDLYILKIAIGPTYHITPWLSISGGPSYQLVSGDYKSEVSGSTSAANSDTNTFMREKREANFESSKFGGYMGSNVRFTKNLYANIGFQVTENSYSLGASAMCRF